MAPDSQITHAIQHRLFMICEAGRFPSPNKLEPACMAQDYAHARHLPLFRSRQAFSQRNVEDIHQRSDAQND
jgi:hypothetical protein